MLTMTGQGREKQRPRETGREQERNRNRETGREEGREGDRLEMERESDSAGEGSRQTDKKI